MSSAANNSNANATNGASAGSNGNLAAQEDAGWKFSQCFGDKGDTEENPGKQLKR